MQDRNPFHYIPAEFRRKSGDVADRSAERCLLLVITTTHFPID